MLRCFEQLTQWDDIAIQVRKALPNTNYDKLWESGYKVNNIICLCVIIMYLSRFYFRISISIIS
jgi:hypothetical protein